MRSTDQAFGTHWVLLQEVSLVDFVLEGNGQIEGLALPLELFRVKVDFVFLENVFRS